MNLERRDVDKVSSTFTLAFCVWVLSKSVRRKEELRQKEIDFLLDKGIDFKVCRGVEIRRAWCQSTE